jgi:uncharacterized cupin superfamily protein
MEIFNIFSGAADIGPDGTEPPGYEKTRRVPVGKKIGATRMGMSIYELDPGQAVCPYHFEWTDEEWLIVLNGRPTLRTPEGQRTVEPGDTVCFPEGPDGAHHIRNDTNELVRVALLSTKSPVGVAEYPDSDKVGVWPGDGTELLFRRSEQREYWDGER